MVDVTGHAKTLFRTLQDSKCNSLNDLILILLGSTQRRVRVEPHRQLATFGAGKEKDKFWWKELGSALEASRWLEKDRVTNNSTSYSELQLSHKAIHGQVLNGESDDAVEILCGPESLLMH